MFSDELIILVLISLLIAYWYDSMRAKEMARTASIEACTNSNVSFLDDTVSLKKFGLRRNSVGQLSIFREYQFDFTSDGYTRYHGSVSVLGKRLLNVDLGVFRV